MTLLLTGYVVLSCFDGFTENSTHVLPRMIFTDTGGTFKRLPAHIKPIRIILGEQPDVVTAIEHTQLNIYNFRDLTAVTAAEWNVQMDKCANEDCRYKMKFARERKNSSMVLLCGGVLDAAVCCYMNISQPSPPCIPNEKLDEITEALEWVINQVHDQSLLIVSDKMTETENTTNIYLTYSGVQDYVGLFKLGSKKMTPLTWEKEKYFAGLILSKRENPSQDRLYTFYRLRDITATFESAMWHSFVSQVCMTDVGGPKNNLQSKWTSEIMGRLFCGDTKNNQRFSEVLDTATVDADHWSDTKIYALFRNEWGITAVCVYTIGNIHKIFMKSSFKGASSDTRSRTCIENTMNLPSSIIREIKATTLVEDWIFPVDPSGPILISQHKYTHIRTDSTLCKEISPNTVMFLSQHNGRIHKVLRTQNQTLTIAEYRPFKHSVHILSLNLHSAFKKLYIITKHELVQVDFANCAQYGNTCEDCVLSRDPHCGWKDGRCTSETEGAYQDIAGGDHTVCKAAVAQASLTGTGCRHFPAVSFSGANLVRVKVPSRSKYFLSCPMSSQHARYTWQIQNHSMACGTRGDRCLLVIDSMGTEQQGVYKCVSEENGYSKVLAHYLLDEGPPSGAKAPRAGPLAAVCLLMLLIKSLYCSS